MKSGYFSDIHQHVLWGLDDGSQSAQQMKELLQQDVENGIRLVYATTHAYPAVRRFEMNLYRERLAEANDCCKANGWLLNVASGCEIRYCDRVPDQLDAGRLPTLGGTRHVLIEFEPSVALEEIKDAADRLYIAGYSLVLAHVERYRCLVTAPERAMAVRDEYGFLLQMNCETVLQPRGFRLRRFVRRMLEKRCIDAIASDAHDTVHRPVLMRKAFQKISAEYGEDYAEQLVSLGWKFIDKARTSGFGLRTGKVNE